jgi:hypothetical protein
MHKTVCDSLDGHARISVKGALTVEDPAAIRIAILRYRCLLDGMLDVYMRQALSEMLAKEESKLSELNRETERL